MPCAQQWSDASRPLIDAFRELAQSECGDLGSVTTSIAQCWVIMRQGSRAICCLYFPCGGSIDPRLSRGVGS